jgi:hypothetical protein
LDAASGQVVDTFEGHQGRVVGLSWSSDGRSLFSGGEDGTLREWEAKTGRSLRTLSGLIPAVFSPDRKHVAWPNKIRIGWGDGPLDRRDRAQIWETERGELQGTILPLRDNAYVTISANGHYCGSPHVERMLVYVVQTDQGQETLTPEEFSKKYGWKNDPERVVLKGESGKQKAELGKGKSDQASPTRSSNSAK